MTGMEPALHLFDPSSGARLQFTCVEGASGQTSGQGSGADGFWQAGDSQVWPQIDGIPFLRVGREALASDAVERLLTGHRVDALGLLLTDVDDFASSSPDRAAAASVVDAVERRQCSALEAMRGLAYGPVADYFALRPSTPTFISGLELLAMHADVSRPVVELACGMGHFLSHLSRHGLKCAGCDVTFSKLWLGRRFLLPAHVPLVCADISGGEAFALGSPDAQNVFCHDAFYFLPDKPKAARRMETLAGADGRVLLGHVHLAGYDHAGIGGGLCSAVDYQALFGSVTHVYDDASLIRAWSTCQAAEAVAAETLAGHEAMAMASGNTASDTEQRPAPEVLRLDPADQLLYPNPLLQPGDNGRLLPAWPSAAFAREYSDATYLGQALPQEPGALPRKAKTLGIEQQIRRIGLPGVYVEVATVPLRWAVIGCGWVARDHVLPAFAHAPSTRLVALCDADANRLASCLNPDGNGPACYTDHREMLQKEKPDVVYIATPNHTHAALCIDVANAGCDVLCEKPMAATLSDAQAMLRTCQSTGITYATAFDQRFHEAHHVLREAVRGGQLGTITQARVHYACQVDTNWRANADDTDNWRLDRERAGGGAVIDLAPHALDLLAFVLGDEPRALDMHLQGRLTGIGAGTLDTDEHAYGSVDAGGILSIEFAGGALASVNVSYQTPEFLPRRDIELIGTLGGARALDTMGQTPGGHIEWRDSHSTHRQTFDEDAGLSPFARQIEAFSSCLKKKQPWPFTPARDLAHFTLLLDAMGRAETRRASAAVTRNPSLAGIESLRVPSPTTTETA